MKENLETISCRDFFALPEVVAQTEIQKRNPHGSDPHKAAEDELRRIADRYGVGHHFNHEYR